MDDPKLWLKFMNYLDYSRNSKENTIPTSKLGLVDNAPIEAIEAYKEFQEYEKERELDGGE